MRQSFAAVACGIALLAISATTTNADPESCRDATEQYSSAKSDVASALSAYTTCIDGSDGHDDCSNEFSTLQSAQNRRLLAAIKLGDRARTTGRTHVAGELAETAGVALY
jgi:hypothetical protein